MGEVFLCFLSPFLLLTRPPVRALALFSARYLVPLVFLLLLHSFYPLGILIFASLNYRYNLLPSTLLWTPLLFNAASGPPLSTAQRGLLAHSLEKVPGTSSPLRSSPPATRPGGLVLTQTVQLRKGSGVSCRNHCAFGLVISIAFHLKTSAPALPCFFSLSASFSLPFLTKEVFCALQDSSVLNFCTSFP